MRVIFHDIFNNILQGQITWYILLKTKKTGLIISKIFRHFEKKVLENKVNWNIF